MADEQDVVTYERFLSNMVRAGSLYPSANAEIETRFRSR